MKVNILTPSRGNKSNNLVHCTYNCVSKGYNEPSLITWFIVRIIVCLRGKPRTCNKKEQQEGVYVAVLHNMLYLMTAN